MLVSALRSRTGASFRLLDLVLDGIVPIVVNYKLLLEYKAVLSRQILTEQLPISAEQVDIIISAILTLGFEMRVHFRMRPNLPDEGDNFISELAFAASPCTIVTHNVRDFQRAELHWPGVFLATPAKVLRMKKGTT